MLWLRLVVCLVFSFTHTWERGLGQLAVRIMAARVTRQTLSIGLGGAFITTVLLLVVLGVSRSGDSNANGRIQQNPKGSLELACYLDNN